MNLEHLKREELIEINSQLLQKVEALQAHLRLILSNKHGKKSEVINSAQLQLFGIEDESNEESDGDENADTETITYNRKKRGKRKPCDEDLERVRVVHDLPEEEKQCACCGEQLTETGEEVSQKYEYVPVKFLVKQHVRKKYACTACKSPASMKTASKDPEILPKSNASEGLLANIITEKYVDGMPLARQEKKYYRHGVSIPRNTMARWCIDLGQSVIPIINVFEDAIRSGPCIHGDETTIQVLKEVGRKPNTKSYLWTRRGGVAGRQCVLFNYDPHRSASVVEQLFSDYSGHVQCDGYVSYQVLEGEEYDILLVGCMAHARRKFTDALKSLSNKEKAQKTKSAEAIAFIKQLYKIEQRIKDSSDEERLAIRQQEAKPILEQFHQWLTSTMALPKSPLGKAINYCLNQWPRLIRYCDAGYLEIDNNSVERAIRPVAIGRKAWLFADTPDGAHTNARFYSLIETCKLHGHEPYAYLKYIFKELPKAQTAEDFEALAPWNLVPETLKELARDL